MYILGLNAYHGDSSACLLKDGKLVAALEEERIRRIKHWAGLPTEAIRFCLNYAGIGLADVDYIALGRDPKAHFIDKVLFTIAHRPKLGLVIDRLRNMGKIRGLASLLAEEFKMDEADLARKIKNVEHHKAHLASAFLVSPFEKAALVSTDGMGDFVGAMWGRGEGAEMKIKDFVEFPHSLGMVYTAVTQYLGFWSYGDEYKVMGLSALGDPSAYIGKLRELLILGKNGRFRLNLKYFQHHKGRAGMTWNNCAPKNDQIFSAELENLLGPARKKNEPISERFQNIAAALQAVYEEGFFHILNAAYASTGLKTLCLAGGTAQNSLANGKIFSQTPFEDVYIPPAAHDAGTSVGAAFYLWSQISSRPRTFVMNRAYWGPEYSDSDIENILKTMNDQDKNRLIVQKLETPNLLKQTAQAIADGKVVGWFQGRSEWGPRALGNRSILADPRRKDMKDILNKRIKYREPFRPFAPSILEEFVGDYFEQTYPVPFMEKVYFVKPEKRLKIPAVTHADGTARLQTVSRDQNSLYWQLISRFHDLTGVPIVLNTSFNENEPIVNNPKEALDCFLRTKMDVVVLGSYFIMKKSG